MSVDLRSAGPVSKKKSISMRENGRLSFTRRGVSTLWENAHVGFQRQSPAKIVFDRIYCEMVLSRKMKTTKTSIKSMDKKKNIQN
jgi:hypothetical protein